jgi:hypothetical protein
VELGVIYAMAAVLRNITKIEVPLWLFLQWFCRFSQRLQHLALQNKQYHALILLHLPHCSRIEYSYSTVAGKSKL